MAPATTAQLHLAIKPRPRRREIGASQRGFVQRLLRRHGCKTRWGAGPGLVLRKQRRLPLQVNLSFEMRCARVWLAQLAAELRWPPQFIEQRQQHAHFSRFAATVMALRSQPSNIQYPALTELRKKLIILPGVAFSLKSELRRATERMRAVAPFPKAADRFAAFVPAHDPRERERKVALGSAAAARLVLRSQEIITRAGQSAALAFRMTEGVARWTESSTLMLKPAATAVLREWRILRDSLISPSRVSMLLPTHVYTPPSRGLPRHGRSQTRFERMQLHYLAALAPPTTATAADGRAGSEMRLRRPERTWEQSHPHAFAPEMTLYRPQRNGDGQRQISAALPEVITAVKAAGSAATPAQPVGLAEPDLSQLTDRVYAELERKMRNERIRRGL